MGFRTLEISKACEIHIKDGQPASFSNLEETKKISRNNFEETHNIKINNFEEMYVLCGCWQ